MTTDTTLPALDHAGESDVPAITRTLSLAFGGAPEGVADWLKLAGIENLRIARAADRTLAGCFLRVPMAQHFGGRSVPMIGIAGVAVPPESRGRGIARSMMASAIRDIAREGAALSCLYASTQALYRQSGYEQAGHRFTIRIPIARLAGIGKARSIRALGEPDAEAIRACYNRFAPRFQGTLDRGSYIWSRVRKLRETTYQGFGVEIDERLAGYLFMSQVRDAATGRHEIHLSDLAFDSPDAGRQLLSFLADFEPMGTDLVLHGGPLHPIQTLLPQQRYKVELKDYWMLRITSIQHALQRRGYPLGIDAALSLHIDDPIVSENAGAWTIRVRDGSGFLTREHAAPLLRCGISGLAAIYSGLHSASAAHLLGLAEGDDRAITLADSIFATGTPWMSDMF